MMRKHAKPKRLFRLSLMLLLCLSLCGCWDYRGLNNLIYVSGIAVDRNVESGDYIVTYEIMQLQENIKQEGRKAKIVESTGRTIAEAVRDANRRVTFKLYFGHSTVLILSEELAIDGEIESLLDWVLRESEMRETAGVAISVGQPAGDLLRLEGLDQSVVANEIDQIMREDHRTASLTYYMQAHEAYNVLNAEGLSLVLPVFHEVYNDGAMVVESNGVAVFKDNIMVGTLSPLESKMLLFMLDKIEGGLLTCELPESGKFFSLAVSKSKTNILYERNEDGQFTFLIKIKTQTRLTQTDITMDMLDRATITQFENYAEEQLKESLEAVTRRVQQEYASDIFGLGNHIHNTDSRLWHEVSENWDQIFKNVIILVEPEVSIVNTEYEKS